MSADCGMSAASAADSVQPVPCRLSVSMRGPSSWIEEQVHRVARQVAALEQHPAPVGIGQQAAQPLGHPAHARHVVGGGLIQQQRGLGQVGRDDGGQRQHGLGQHADGIGRQQHVATLGDHHRIDHQRRQLTRSQQRPQRIGHRARNGGGAQHAQLGAVDAHVIEQRVDLQPDEVGGDALDAGDGPGVLGGERTDDGAAIGPQRREGLDVGQHARPATGINAGHSEQIGNGARGRARLAGKRRRIDVARHGAVGTGHGRTPETDTETDGILSPGGGCRLRGCGNALKRMGGGRRCSAFIPSGSAKAGSGCQYS